MVDHTLNHTYVFRSGGRGGEHAEQIKKHVFTSKRYIYVETRQKEHNLTSNLKKTVQYGNTCRLCSTGSARQGRHIQAFNAQADEKVRLQKSNACCLDDTDAHSPGRHTDAHSPGRHCSCETLLESSSGKDARTHQSVHLLIQAYAHVMRSVLKSATAAAPPKPTTESASSQRRSRAAAGRLAAFASVSSWAGGFRRCRAPAEGWPTTVARPFSSALGDDGTCA